MVGRGVLVAGLLLLAGIPAPAAAKAAAGPTELLIPDGSFDVRLAPANHAPAYGDFADLRALRLDAEGLDSFRISWRLAELHSGALVPAVNNLHLVAGFSVEGAGDFVAKVSWPAGSLATDGGMFSLSGTPTVCMGRPDRACSSKTGLQAGLDVPNREVQLRIPKAALKSIENSQTFPLEAGRSVSGFWDTVTASGLLQGNHLVTDELDPNQAAYTLRYGVANTEIVLRPESRGKLVLAPDTNATFELEVNNQGLEPRLVTLEYPQALDYGLQIGGPRYVWTPARGSVTVGYWIWAPPMPNVVTVTGFINGTAGDLPYEPAVAPFSVRVGPGLDPRDQGFALTMEGSEFRWSPRSTRGTASEAEVPFTRSYLTCWSGQFSVTSLPVLANAWAAGLHGSLQLTLRASRPIQDLRIEATLPGFASTEEFDLDTRPKVVTISGELATAIPVLRRGEPMTSSFQLKGQCLPDAVEDLRVYIGLNERSLLDLPTVPDPRSEGLVPVRGIQVRLVEPGPAFVNPGEWRAFGLGLFNGDEEERTAHIELEAAGAEWRAQLRPGDDFRLPPGRSFTVLGLLRAPVDAREGAKGTLTFTVSDAEGELAVRKAEATVVTRPDLENDIVNATADNDTISALIRNPDRTPAPMLGGIVVLVVAAVAIRRLRPS